MKAMDIARDEWPALRWRDVGGALFGTARHNMTRIVVADGRVSVRHGAGFLREHYGAGGLRRALRRARYEIARERGEAA